MHQPSKRARGRFEFVASRMSSATAGTVSSRPLFPSHYFLCAEDSQQTSTSSNDEPCTKVEVLSFRPFERITSDVALNHVIVGTFSLLQLFFPLLPRSPFSIWSVFMATTTPAAWQSSRQSRNEPKLLIFSKTNVYHRLSS